MFSVASVAAWTIMAVIIANLPPLQWVFTTSVPLFWRLEPVILSGTDLLLAVGLQTAIVLVVLLPLYKPRPRRILDTFFLALQRVIVAGCVLATLGYYHFSALLPRPTLTLTIGFLGVGLPLWFVWIRLRPRDEVNRAIIIGDDREQIADLLASADLPYVGYLAPTAVERHLHHHELMADGGVEIRRLSGLSRTEDCLVNHEIDTAVLAFSEPDRGEFFGVLDACYGHGVDAKVHRQCADVVLTDGVTSETLHNVSLEPWDVQDYLAKRAFDLVFATVGLIVMAPLMAAIAVAIKLEDGSPVFYRQRRTTGFGKSFTTWKFRTMTTSNQSADPTEGVDRVTRIGGILRNTHLDELPQLWSILLNRMSVVGPRAVWVEEENVIEADIDPEGWRQRWFVKPGLTGLAQINEADSTDPEVKLRYDLEYIRRQSFWFDVRIVLRQLWTVWADSVEAMTGTRRVRDSEEEELPEQADGDNRTFGD